MSTKYPGRFDTLGTLNNNLRSIGILVIGDSHAAGRLNTAVVSGAEKLGLYAFSSSRDRHWTGSADAPQFPMDNSIGAVNGSTQDPNTGGTVNTGSFTAWIPMLLRQSFPNDLKIIRVANTAIGGSSSFTWAGETASGYLQVLVLPTVGDTVTVGSVVYTFRASASIANEVTIGGTLTATAINLANAINAESTGWGTGTVANPGAYCPNAPASGLFRIFALSTGTAGNSTILSTSNGTSISVYQAFAGGSATSAQYAASKAQIPSGFGSVDIVIITLGTNDAGRVGYRGRGTAAEMVKLIANIHADYPLAKIILWRTPTTTAGGLTQASIAGVVAAMDAVVAANPLFVSAVDMNALGNPISADTSIVSADGIHLTSYAYSFAAQMYSRKIATALGLF